VRILVTGGTGFIGSALVRAIGQRGDEAVVVSRRGGATTVGWDAVQREVERADAVVHLAGEPIADARWTEGRLAKIRDSRVRSTETMARAIAKASRKPRVFVSGSAVGIYGMRDDDRELDENAPPGDDVLARIAVTWEGAAVAARSTGVRVVYPRTGVVLGKGGGALARMAAPFRLFVGGPLGTGRQWVSWIHLRDVVRALLFAVDSEALAGPFNVVSPAPVTMETLARSIAYALGRPAVMRVPALALEVVLGEGRARMLLTGQRVVPQKLLDAGFVFDFPRVEDACADLLQD
jgi:uncharacterized protein (TIGR01777 family)